MRVKFLVPTVLAAVLAGASTASAENAHADGPSGLAIYAAFGNTIMSIYPDGRSQKIWMHPDGTWTGQSRRGIPLAGKWTAKDDRVCLRQSKPPTLPISFCQTMPQDPAVTLTSHDLTGRTIRLKIVKGIVEAANAGPAASESR